MGQVAVKTESATCTHALSLYNLSPDLEIVHVRLSAKGNTKIILANAPNGFGTASQYPSWVDWTCGNQPFFPPGNPISGEFQLLMEPEYGSKHLFAIAWTTESGEVMCMKELSIPCQKTKILSAEAQLQQLGSLITYKNSMLEFRNSQALLEAYEFFSIEFSPTHQQQSPAPSQTAAPLAIDYLKRKFKGFQPLYNHTNLDTNWHRNMPLTGLLNQDQALSIDGVIFQFNGPNLLFTVPKSGTQRDDCEKMRKSSFSFPLPEGVSWYNLNPASSHSMDRGLLPEKGRQLVPCDALFAIAIRNRLPP